MREVWPPDVAVTSEATGFDMRFLHSWLSIKGTRSTGYVADCHPFNPNIDFVRGKALHPNVARIGLYIKDFQTAADLHKFVWPHLALACRVYEDMHHGWEKYLAEFITEIFKMCWPPVFISQSLRGFPRRQRCWFAIAVRQLGRKLHSELPMWQAAQQMYIARGFDSQFPWLQLVQMSVGSFRA